MLRIRSFALPLILGVSAPASLAAQSSVAGLAPAAALRQAVPTQALTTAASAGRPAVIRWWQPVAVAGGIGALMLADGSVDRWVQRQRSATGDDIASVVRHCGQPEVFVTVPLGMMAVGWAAGRPELTRAGGRAAVSVLLAGAAAGGLKLAAGRGRPSEGADPGDFSPFSGSESFPSGHTTVAFALATSLADDIPNAWADVGLYAGATAVAWSRLNDHKHWLSDVAAGAAIGITSAKLVDGRWRVFGIRPPAVLVGPQGMALSWQATF